MSTQPAVQVTDVRKRFGDTEALSGVGLEVAEGEVVGLLGPNGAGKTTLVRVLATLLPPDSGTARIFGLDVVDQAPEVRRTIGLTGQYAAVDELLTGRENLRMFGELFHLSGRQARRRADELLERFDLAHAADRAARTYSGGMRRRLDLASSLLVRPRLLFLDEPTTGLDPRSRNAIWDVTRELVAEGTTLLLTTQYLEEADQLADRIAVIDHGTIIAEGTGDDLKDRVGGQVIDIALAAAEDATTACELVAHAEPTDDPRRIRVPVDADDALGALSRVSGQLAGAGIYVRDVGLRRPTLDEVFLELTGEVSAPEGAGGTTDDHAPGDAADTTDDHAPGDDVDTTDTTTSHTADATAEVAPHPHGTDEDERRQEVA